MTKSRKPGPPVDVGSLNGQAKAIAPLIGVQWKSVAKWASLPGGIAAGLRRFYLNQEARALGRRSE